jgi:hypothetical protein
MNKIESILGDSQNFEVANARRVKGQSNSIHRTPDRSITEKTMSNIRDISVDNVSGVVYSTDELMESQRSRQVFYDQTRRKAMLITDMPYNVNKLIKRLTQECVRVVSGTQTRLRKYVFTRISLRDLRKGKLNTIQMRKSTRLKETTYGPKLYDRQ